MQLNIVFFQYVIFYCQFWGLEKWDLLQQQKKKCSLQSRKLNDVTVNYICHRTIDYKVSPCFTQKGFHFLLSAVEFASFQSERAVYLHLNLLEHTICPGKTLSLQTHLKFGFTEFNFASCQTAVRNNMSLGGDCNIPIHIFVCNKLLQMVIFYTYSYRFN